MVRRTPGEASWPSTSFNASSNDRQKFSSSRALSGKGVSVVSRVTLCMSFTHTFTKDCKRLRKASSLPPNPSSSRSRRETSMASFFFPPLPPPPPRPALLRARAMSGWGRSSTEGISVAF